MRTIFILFLTFVRDKVGWNKLGFLASFVVLCLAGLTLYRMLRDVQPDRVWSAISAMPATHIGLSIAFVAAAEVLAALAVGPDGCDEEAGFLAFGSASGSRRKAK